MAGARQLFSEAGVDFSQPGKQLVYNERLGMLMLRATIEELEIVERIVQVWNTPELPMPTTPPQVSLEVKFCEITEASGKNLGLEWMLDGVARRQEPFPRQQPAKAGIDASLESIINGSFLSAAPPPNTTDAGAATLVGILKEPQFRAVLRALEQQRGVDLLSAPRVTTMSGRQAQIKRVEVRYILTNTVANPVVIERDAQKVELGPIVDVVPYVLADGVTIRMTVIPRIKQFVGYDIESSAPLPIFRERLMVTSVSVWDGQTLVLIGGSPIYTTPVTDTNSLGDIPLERRAARVLRANGTPNERKTLLVFVTPIIIDPAGNRVNPPDKMLFRQNTIPPKPRDEQTTP